MEKIMQNKKALGEGLFHESLYEGEMLQSATSLLLDYTLKV